MSKLFSLGQSDVIKAIVVAILAPIVGYVLTILQGGSLAVDWHQVLILALTGFLSYILKNFLSNSNGEILGIIG